NGMSGVDPSTPGAGQQPTFTEVTISDPDHQYKLCFNCHSNWSAGSTKNVDIAFNTNNDSYHWVENDKGSPKIYSSATFNSTYVGKMMPRYDGASNATLRSAKMRCTDCHGSNVSDGGVSIPEGPHGSGKAKILKQPAGSTYTSWSSTTDENNAWCFNCHNPTFSGTGLWGDGKNLHTYHLGKSGGKGGYCQDCHIAIPHGSGNQGVGSSNQRKHLLSPSVFTEGADGEISGNWSQHGSWVIPGCT
ncbi:MAG: hypothetical protein GTO60_08075, partial [Gammaproteobacteria bacterium]|nr:hypothetical protein [Gammaproteobacteria bacterium]